MTKARLADGRMSSHGAAAPKRPPIKIIFGATTMSDSEVHHRRLFLRQVATGVATAPRGLSPTASVAATAPASRDVVPDSAPVEHAWRFFNGNEARTAEAVVARIIPTDETGPGASEAGVAK